ncbi:hypothetical protein LEMLEM_LOCUS17627 [Lemmus lemmus]
MTCFLLALRIISI